MRIVGISVALSLVAGAIAIATAASSVRPEVLPTAAQVELLPNADLGAISGAVGRTMATGHYSARPIDDERSKAWLDRYINALDPQRLYFVQKDIDEFHARWWTNQDDDIQSPQPKLEAPYAIHKRFRQRVSERLETVQAILATPLKLDEPKATVDIDREGDPWAASPGELDTIWKGRLIAQIIDLKLSDAAEGDPVGRLVKRYERIKRAAFDVDAEDILEVWLAALTETFDPHSIWFKPVSRADFDIDMQDALIGIGAVLEPDDGYTVIKELVVGGPAEASGLLHAGDKILAVAQGDEAPVDIVEMRLDRVVQFIRGKEGTPVTLTIKPADATDPSETRIIKLIREKVKLSRAAAKGELKTVPGPSGPVTIGVLDVPSFYEDTEGEQAGQADYGSTTRDVAKLITQWQAQGNLGGLLVDLRENGGGSLDQALQLTGLFLPGGPVVQVRSRDGEIEILKDPDAGQLYDGPVIVLTSELSASASEIFAAALQDYGRATIIGSTTTHGKGTVQNMIGLERQLIRMGATSAAERAGAIKFTTHMFYRINGDSTQINGVSADVRIPSPFSGLKYRESDLDFALPWDQIPAAHHRTFKTEVDLAAVQAASDARVAADREFGWLTEDLAHRAELDKEEVLSIDLTDRQAELAEDKAREEARKAARVAAGWKEGDKIDPVLEEALRVTGDIIASATKAHK